MKTAMVLKAKDVIRRGCLEYDVSATDITTSFVAIRKTMTSGGRSATYEASRTGSQSRGRRLGDHDALLNEPHRWQRPGNIIHSGVQLMSKYKRPQATATKAPRNMKDTAPPKKWEAFTFGEPSAVLDRRDILDYVECVNNGKWFEPPVSFNGLAKSLRAAVHHSSPIYVKRNILASTFIPHPLLSQQDFSRFALDFLVFGNAF